MTTFAHPTSSRLVELYLERKEDIENSRNRNADACRKRKAAWTEIIEILSTETPGFTCTAEQARKHYQYLKSQAKEKAQTVKRFDIGHKLIIVFQLNIIYNLFHVAVMYYTVTKLKIFVDICNVFQL